MSKKKVLIINGPNINLLGDREKHIYGELSLKEHNEKLKKYGEKKNLNLSFFQSNHEGEIINIIQNSRKKKRCNYHKCCWIFTYIYCYPR